MAGSLIHGSGVVQYLDELDVSCALNAADIMLEREVIDARTFCGNNQVPGRHIGGSTFAGFGMFGTSDYEEKMDSLIRSSSDANHLLVMGTAAGSRAYEVRGPLSKEAHAWNVAQVLGLNGEIPKGTSIARGLALHVAQAFTATGAQTGQNIGAVAATETFVATIRVPSVSGAGSITFRFDESQNDGSPDTYAQITGLTIVVGGLASAGTDNVTFTGAGWARLYKTAAVEAWRRLNITAFSGFTSVTATVMSGTQVPA